MHSKRGIISKLTYSSKIPYEQSVSGYLLGRLERHTEINDYQHFLTQVEQVNKKIPENVYLLIGNHNNAALTTRLEQERKLYPTPNDNPWKRVTLFIKAFIEGLIQTNEPPKQYCFFIDTDSSFSIYTQMAIIAAKSLIVPFAVDEKSVVSFRSYALVDVWIYYAKFCTTPNKLGRSLFSKAHHQNLEFPKLHLFIFNKATYNTYSANSSIPVVKTLAAVFAAIRDQYGKIVHNFYKSTILVDFSSCVLGMQQF